MDKILVEGAVFLAHVGVSAEERTRRQEIRVDLIALTDTRRAGKTDNLHAGVSYADMHDTAAKAIAGKKYHLIEAIAEDIAGALLESFLTVQGVTIKVAKPAALSDRAARSAAVEITRMRDE